MRHIGSEAQQDHGQDVAISMLGNHLSQFRRIDFLEVQINQHQIRPKPVDILQHL